MTSRSKVLPAPYFYFFWLVEPLLTIAGGVSAIVDPVGWISDLLPARLEKSTFKMGATTRGQTVIGQLGSCFFLLAMISFSLFYLFNKHLADKPALQQKFVKGLLIPLAIADLLHIGLTLLPLPVSHLQTPSEWTYILHSTIWITATLFVVRLSWLLGIGRASAASFTTSATRQTRLPLPKGYSEAAVEQITPVEESSPVQITTTPAKKRVGRTKKIVEDD